MLTVIPHVTTKTSIPGEFHILRGVGREENFSSPPAPTSAISALVLIKSLSFAMGTGRFELSTCEVGELPQGVKGPPTAPRSKVPCIVVVTFSGDCRNPSDVRTDGKEWGASSFVLPAPARANKCLPGTVPRSWSLPRSPHHMRSWLEPGILRHWEPSSWAQTVRLPARAQCCDTLKGATQTKVVVGGQMNAKIKSTPLVKMYWQLF